MSRSPARASASRPDTAREGNASTTSASQVRLKAKTPAETQALERAQRAVRDTPFVLSAWDELERLCEDSEQPELVSELYLRVLTPGVSREAVEPIARRAHGFFERWFGDDVATMQKLLGRVLEACPEAEWALDALVTLLTVGGHWDALLDAYERALNGSLSAVRRRQVLRDAVYTAKDFADRPERAVAAISELVRIAPGESGLRTSLARTLEERKQWRPLMSLWQSQLESEDDATSATLRLQMAQVLLAQLDDVAGAVAQATHVLERHPGHEAACAVLERVLATQEAARELRLDSLARLRLHHDSAGRAEGAIRALSLALEFANSEESVGLRRELGARLSMRGEDVAAMVQLAELLKAAPEDVDARLQLRLLAQRSDEHERHAAALIAAAHGTTDPKVVAELLLGAMRLMRDRLARPSEAISLGQRVLEQADLERPQVREAASAVAQLLRGGNREGERLAALERLARCEDDEHARRRLLSEIAGAFRGAGEPERALAAWNAHLDHEPGDVEALSKAIELCAELGEHRELVKRLRQRADLAHVADQRRRDLVRIAETQARELQDADAAVDTWLALREEYGDAADVMTALDGLLSNSQRFTDLARMLESDRQREHAAAVARACRLGDVYREQLAQPQNAARAYATALELDAKCAEAHAGLRALLDAKQALREACAVLASAYKTTDDVQGTLSLLEARLSASDDAAEQASWLLEAARLYEQRVKDAPRALSLVGKALTRLPLQVHVERELLRLAEQSGRRREAAQALHWAAAAASGDRERAADLSAMEARILEALGETKGAAEAYQQVIGVRPRSREDAHGLVRTAAASGNFTLACQTALRACVVRGALESDMLSDIERAAKQAQAFAAFRDGLTSALREVTNLPALVSAGLELKLASVCLAHCDDATGAERAARRALALMPENAAALTLLVDVQRRTGSAEIIDTLLALDARSPAVLEPITEAAERLEALKADAATQQKVWTRLYTRAKDRWIHAGEDRERWALVAVNKTWPLALAAGQADVALTLLEEAARLPFAREERARLGMRSVEILISQKRNDEALQLGLSLIGEPPADLAFVRALGKLSAELGKVPEELVLRQRELELCSDANERLALRLEIARLTGVLEARGSRLRMLLDNLAEQPGHPESLEVATRLLSDQRRFQELVSLLSEQAAQLARGHAPRRAAALWRRAAELSEQRLNEPAQAVAFYEHLMLAGEDQVALDELIRLSRTVGDHVRTARWLEHKLHTAPAAQRPALAVELARAELAAGRRADAINTLQRSFAQTPDDVATGALLAELLREDARHDDLADVLAQLAQAASERMDTTRLAREAARLYHSTLAQPEKLVEVADLALGLCPEDSELCSMMADALCALGRYADARGVLTHSLGQFGRRRSPERAAVHVQLAEVLRREGDLARCCAELELALTMRPGDASIINALAERAGEAGDLPRRERALHALYLSVKRGPVKLDREREIGVSEVLLALSEVAQKRGDSVQATSLCESAMAALRFDDPECARIKRSLRERGSVEIIEQILRTEMTRASSDIVRAQCVAELADLLESQAARKTEALSLRLESLELDPGDPRLHEAALKSARECGQLARFRSALERLRERLRRPSDAFARCEVALRLGHLRLESGDAEGALSLYAEAESTGVREGDVWHAQLDVCMTRGDAAGQERLLKKLATLGGSDGDGEARVDVLYRLAEIRLGVDATRAEGIERMRAIFADALRPVRAARLVLRVREGRRQDRELLSLLREVASLSGELDLMQIAEHCAALGDEEALEALSELSKKASPALRATLLVERARVLSGRPNTAAQVSELLGTALSLREGDVQAEALLLAHYKSQGQHREALAYLQQRFQQARSVDDKESSLRYALLLHEAADADSQAVLPALRAAVRLAPERHDLREALLSRLEASEHPGERASAIELALEQGEPRDAAQLALEAAELYRRENDAEGVARVLSLGRRHAPRHPELLKALVECVRGLDLPEVLAELLESAAREETEAEQRARGFCEAARLQKTRLGDPAAATRLYELALAATPQDTVLRRTLVDDLLAQGRTAEAVTQLAQAVQHARDAKERASFLHLRGRTLLAQNRCAEGLSDLEQALEHDADLVAPDLLAALEAVLSHSDPGSAEARNATFRLVHLRRTRTEAPQAAMLLEQWLAGSPDDGEALTLLSELYADGTRPDALAEVLIKRLARPDSEPVAGTLANQLAALVPMLPRAGAARAALERAHTRWPAAEDVEEALIDALSFVPDDRAIATLLLARAERARDAAQRTRSLSRAAEHLIAADAVPEAIQVLGQLRAITPGDIDTALALTDRLIDAQRFSEARTLLETMIDPRSEGHSPTRSRLLLRLSRAARGERDHEAALATMLMARDADKTNRVALAELAVLAEELSAWDVAERALTSLLLLKDAVMPRPEMLLRRARVARFHGGPQRALLWARKALEADPESAEAAELVRLCADPLRDPTA